MSDANYKKILLRDEEGNILVLDERNLPSSDGAGRNGTSAVIELETLRNWYPNCLPVPEPMDGSDRMAVGTIKVSGTSYRNDVVHINVDRICEDPKSTYKAIKSVLFDSRLYRSYKNITTGDLKTGCEGEYFIYTDFNKLVVYSYKSTVSYSDLPPAAEAALGDLYVINESFTTGNYFVEGMDKEYPANTKVVCVVSDTIDGTHMWDVLTNGDLIDITTEAEGYIPYVDNEDVIKGSALLLDRWVGSVATEYPFSLVHYTFDLSMTSKHSMAKCDEKTLFEIVYVVPENLDPDAFGTYKITYYPEPRDEVFPINNGYVFSRMLRIESNEAETTSFKFDNAILRHIISGNPYCPAEYGGYYIRGDYGVYE